MTNQAKQTNREALVTAPAATRELVAALRHTIKGRVVTPDEPGYDDLRAVYFSNFDSRPAAVVRTVDAEDISQVISLARQAGVELAVRSGGHSVAGHSLTEGGLVIDLREMKKLEIDPQGHTAWAETGLSTGEYTSETGLFGLASGFGDTGSVGIGGITLGGGIGFLVRKHGLTIDNLLAADLVTADGQIRRVDAENHPDLFWAIRGGGGNFGVAARFQYRLQEVDQIVGGLLFLPATPEVTTGFIAAAEAAPEELSTIANIMPAPPMPFLPAEHHGKPVLMAMMVYAGNVDEGLRAVTPFRQLARPLADMLRPMRYPEMYPPEPLERHPAGAGRVMFADRIGRPEAETIDAFLHEPGAARRFVQLRVLGGAMARVPADATAFAHRQSRILVNLAVFTAGEQDRGAEEAWIQRLAAALDQGQTGAYVNF
ncbi:MAG TPA: FAD-dependent oxidoreductase, partial [Anaerolineaceae bacterium]|nr:FAD-dependent oxidoreductase [Anaerolineaceae bacterium]